MIVKDEIELDDATHTYWDKRGRRVVGVSELLANLGYIGNFSGQEDALKRGRNVHLAIHFYEKGTLDEGSLSPRIKPYFESYLGFRAATRGIVKLTEALVFDDVFRLAATLDSLWEIDGRPAVIDYKTGAVSDWVKYQTASHVNGLPPLADRGDYLRFGLQLKGDGKPATLVPFEDKQDLMKVRMFASVFYTRVNDGVAHWPQTREGLEKQRREDYGLELFEGVNAHGGAANRNGAATLGETSDLGLIEASANGS